MKVIGINTIDEHVLRQVMNKMRTLGAPIIRVITHQGKRYAIEGTHRLAAAERLGLRPNIVEVADDSTDASVEIANAFGSRSATVGQLRATLVIESNTRPIFDV